MTRHDARITHVLATVAAAAMLLLPACDRGATEAEAPAARAAAETRPNDAGPAPADLASATAAATAAAPAAEAGPAGPPPPSRAPEADRFEATSTGLGSGGALMTFDEVVHDFGVVWDVQSDLPAEFGFVNTGTATLEIVDMKADCGCTVPNLDKRRYEPGERGVIKVRYSPKGIGPTEKFINLITNVGGQGVSRVAIRSEARRFAWADPPNLQFQPAELGVPHRAVVKIQSADPSFTIDEVWTTTGSVHASGASGFLEARLLEGTSPPEMEIVLNEEAPWGSSFAVAHASGTGTIPGGEARQFDVRIMVNADLFGELRADRTYYTLKLVPPGASFEQSLRLRRESGEPFEVLSAEIRGGTMPGTRVEARPIADGEGAGYDIVLSGETGSYVGPIMGSVIVETDVPGEEKIELRFSGLVREANK